jgi:hypothetical protein
MYRLLRIAIAMLFVCEVAVCTAKFLGSREVSPLALWLTDPDGRPCATPCLFGIQPGATKFDDAIKIMATHPVTRNLQKREVYENSVQLWNDSFSLLFLRNRNGQVEAVVVQNHEEISLGELMANFGYPSDIRVGNYDSPNYYFFFDGRLSVEEWFKSDICIYSPAANLVLRLELRDNDHRGSNALKWKGFASRKIYARLRGEVPFSSNCRW